jgi:hypothetical protein
MMWDELQRMSYSESLRARRRELEVLKRASKPCRGSDAAAAAEGPLKEQQRRLHASQAACNSLATASVPAARRGDISESRPTVSAWARPRTSGPRPGG